MIGFKPPRDLYEDYPPRKNPASPEEADEELYPFAKQPFTRKERMMYSLIALKAALLIGACFMGGLGIIIFILTRIWS